ncbi:MAG: TAXI family TRAP transporter solute-binding subunit [Alphaproteobacteria bacterium]|nr:TAXI family TRAP transporter solute-binding subunit [Alphaproteobacteria bacterium]
MLLSFRRLTLSVLTGSLVALAAASANADEKLVTVGTAGVTGVYYPAGGAICRLVNRGRKEHGIRCAVESTGGSISNLDAMRAGELDMGIVQSDWLYHAYKGSDLFADEGPNHHLRAVFSLHSEPFIVLTRADAKIDSFDQLKGKRINIGSPGSGMRATMEALMKRKGWTEKSFASVMELKPSEQAQALCANRIDAMIYAAGNPNGAIQQVTMLCNTKLVGVTGPDADALVQENPYYFRAVIPGGMYQGNPNPVQTIGVEAVLVAPDTLSPEIVYDMVKAVFDNLDNFKTLHPVFATLDAPHMVHDAATLAPLHEGAARYYREKGLLH